MFRTTPTPPPMRSISDGKALKRSSGYVLPEPKRQRLIPPATEPTNGDRGDKRSDISAESGAAKRLAELTLVETLAKSVNNDSIEAGGNAG